MAAVDRMVKCKCRLDTSETIDGIENNITWVFSSTVLRCYDQATKVLNKIDKNNAKFDDKWTFIMVSSPRQYWLEGRSSNNTDRMVLLNPWRNSIETMSPGSAPSGEPVSSFPSEECPCKNK